MNYSSFSILIAQYNNGEFLQEAIESVKKQTYTNWEIIIVDDGSTDNSKEIYELYKNDSKVKIYYNGKNKGCGYTKRRCVELATGDICGFLDSDDVLLPEALQLMIDVHNKNPMVSLVFSRFYHCDENLNVLEESRKLEIMPNESYFTHRDYRPEVFASFKKEYYNKTKGISDKYKLGIDQDLYFKLEEVGELYILDKFTYKYRKHKTNSSLTSGNWKKALYWNIIIRHDTALRRGLDIELYSFADFLSVIHRIDSAEQKASSLRNSRPYKLGAFLLKPIILLKKIFK